MSANEMRPPSDDEGQRDGAVEAPRVTPKPGMCYGQTHVWLQRGEAIADDQRCECGALTWAQGQEAA